MVNEEDMTKLQYFVLSVQEDLDIIISRIKILAPEMEELHELLNKSWKEVSPRFSEINDYIWGRKPLENLHGELEIRGLTGIQLELKLKLHKLRRDEFKSELEKFEKASEEQKKKKGFIWRIIRRLLRVIDRILDSLGVIPGIDAAKEIKGVLEEFI